jgi:hypothetical protein
MNAAALLPLAEAAGYLCLEVKTLRQLKWRHAKRAGAALDFFHTVRLPEPGGARVLVDVEKCATFFERRRPRAAAMLRERAGASQK